MRTAFIALLLVSGFYLMTAEVVQHDGSFRVDLAVKPYPSLVIGARVDPEETWQRDHAGEAMPWWQRGVFVSLVQGDWEYGRPWWSDAYASGFVAIMMAWPGLGGLWAVCRLSRRRAAQRQQ